MKEFLPKMYAPNIYQVNYDLLKKKGVTCLLFDLDNTLVGPHGKEVSEELKSFMKKLKQDFLVIIFSNSLKPRVQFFKEQLQVEMNHTSLKPHAYSFHKVFKKYHLSPHQVAIIGDQLFTDIVGGNRVGITTILVEPITLRDFWITKYNRYREEKKFKELEQSGLWKKGKYYDEV